MMSQISFVRKYPHRSGMSYWVNSLNWDEALLVVEKPLVSVLSSIILDVSVTPDRGHEIAEFFCVVVDDERFSLLSEDDGDENSFKEDVIGDFAFLLFFLF